MGVNVGNVSMLPKWAQELIATLERQREAAIKTLNEFTDTQTKTDIWIDDHVCTGEGQGPSTKRKYVQAYSVTFKLGCEEISVSHCFDRPTLRIASGMNALLISPTASNCIEIKENVR